MSKIKLTKNELKIQRDALKRFERYLPTLQLKKQQLQLEVRQTRENLSALDDQRMELLKKAEPELALYAAADEKALNSLLAVTRWETAMRNIAGTDVPVHKDLRFEQGQWDLFSTPLWMDDAIAMFRRQTEVLLQRKLLLEQLQCIEEELRTVSQRVNLFEKVKIPDAQENIRRINITIGDQQTNSVGRSKIAKGKCQERDAQTLNAQG